MTTFDTTGLTDWPLPADMETAAADLATKAGEFKDGVEDCENEWKGLSAHFSMDESTATDRVLNFYDLVTAHGEVVKATAEKTKDVIGDFAEDVRVLQVRRTTAYGRIDEHNRLVDAGDEPTGIYTETSVQEYINTVVGDLVTKAEECSGKLEAITVDALVSDGLTPPGLTAGTAVSVAKMTEFDRVNFTYNVVERHQVPIWDYTTTAPSADWVVDADGNVTRAPFVTSREVSGYRYEHRTVQQTGTRTSWVGLQTPVNEWAYRHIPAYRERVDLNPDRYSRGGPRFWDVKGRLLDFEDALRHGNNWTKTLRVAGPLATLVTAGLTYKSEYDKALVELAMEHPDWSTEQIQARAQEMSAVQGTTQVALDFGYGAAGAAVGTFIGGPIGTVVGFGVGMGIGWIAENTGFNDVVKDGAQWVWDKGSDVAEDFGGAVSDAWDSIFG
ncbi:hypothetical protein [Citricoccus sp. GCM10030269]|uniref:hypothetical protein n=1 Tax=Citricoccus sp. GCM10030269 TaxID=3273388 RepID=UPI003623DCFD